MTTCEKVVEFYKTRDLSGDNIDYLIGKAPILYRDLGKVKSIKELLGKEGYAVILYETSSRTDGHWVALYERFDGVLCFADSYGLKYDTEQQYAEYTAKLPRYLTQLIESSGMDVDYNKVDYQNKSSRIATCGRYATFFCLFGQHMTFPEIQSFLMRNQDAFLTPDNIVTLCTLWGLGEIRHFFDRQNRSYMGKYQ